MNPTPEPEAGIAEVAASLSEAQRAAMLHRRAGGSSYAWARIGTLDALHARGLVKRIAGPGAFYSPQTAIEWPLTDYGKAVRQHLARAQGED